jgi:hypothetical protein
LRGEQYFCLESAVVAKITKKCYLCNRKANVMD